MKSRSNLDANTDFIDEMDLQLIYRQHEQMV
jgi:hypothetical protein